MSSAADQARDNLQKIEHFIVLMLENRSFDQMLGYLEFEEFGSHDLDGLKPAEDKRLINSYNGQEYEPKPAQRTA
ncbi:MAG: hypothetical protein M3318_05820, partial [Actinomycetota bacterium]|nr:hypothetical protein [Actinomycetota bacterium]